MYKVSVTLLHLLRSIVTPVKPLIRDHNIDIQTFKH